MKNLKQWLPIVLALTLAGTIVFGQSVLGNMYKLGTTTTAGRPSSSSTIQGALLYDTDVNSPIYNTGSAWSTLGGSAGYWFDGGAGNIWSDALQAEVGNSQHVTWDGGVSYWRLRSTLFLSSFDAGAPLGIWTEKLPSGSFDTPADYQMVLANSLGSSFTGIGFWNGAPPTTIFKGAIVAGSPGGQFASELSFIGGSGSTAEFAWMKGGTRGMLFNIDSTGRGKLSTQEFSALGNATNYGFTVTSNGVRYDFGTGANDYLSGDGTNIAAASQFSATRLDSTTNGVYMTAGSVPTAAGSGHLYASSNYDTDTGSSTFTYDGQQWRQLGMGKNWGAQKKALQSEVSPERTDCYVHQVNLRNSSGAQLGSTCRTRTQAGTIAADATATSSFLNGRFYRMSTTVGNSPGTDVEKAYHFTGTTDTFEAFTQTRLKWNYCTWIQTPSALTTVRLFNGLANSDFLTAASTDAPTSNHIAMLRYSTGTSDSNWMLVTCGGTACTATSTGVTVKASTAYQVCIDVSADDASVRAYVNEYGAAGTVTTNTTNLPTTSTFLGVYHVVMSLGDVARAFGMSNYSVETN